MQVAINIENANKNMISALKAVLKTQPDVKFKIKEKKQSWDQEYIKLIQDYKLGKVKSYSKAKEMHKNIING